MQKWPLERFNQIYLSVCDLCHPKEAPCQNRRKVTEAFLRYTPSPLNLDGRTDRRTDRRTTDNSVLEKLRCLSAGGAKKFKFNYTELLVVIWYWWSTCSNGCYVVNNKHNSTCMLQSGCLHASLLYHLWSIIIRFRRLVVIAIVLSVITLSYVWEHTVLFSENICSQRWVILEDTIPG